MLAQQSAGCLRVGTVSLQLLTAQTVSGRRFLPVKSPSGPWLDQNTRFFLFKKVECFPFYEVSGTHRIVVRGAHAQWDPLQTAGRGWGASLLKYLGLEG